MFKQAISLILLYCAVFNAHAQSLKAFAENIRISYCIPELNYAIVSGDSVYELQALGEKKIHSDLKATVNDKFRLGSNTKAITGFIAAQLVKQGKIKWDTDFFELFPNMKKAANPDYHDMTLLDMLSFRTNLVPYTYTDKIPRQNQFTGDDDADQRRQFVEWALKQKPRPIEREIKFSNVGYAAAGLMMEKVSGEDYKQLVKELGDTLGIDFNFGSPNFLDDKQTWGHDENLKPEAPADNYKLNWLLAAGNINVSLKDYVKFLQLQLKGLRGKDTTFLNKSEFEFLHYGLPEFAVGWFWEVNDHGQKVSHNTGNPGTFMTEVSVIPDKNRAYVIFTNVQSEDAEKAIAELMAEMKHRWN